MPTHSWTDVSLIWPVGSKYFWSAVAAGKAIAMLTV